MEVKVPLQGKIRYRWVEKGGKKIRLAFRGKKKVVEVKVKGGTAKRVGGGGRAGNPRTEEERKRRHKRLYGTTKLPPRRRVRLVSKT